MERGSKGRTIPRFLFCLASLMLPTLDDIDLDDTLLRTSFPLSAQCLIQYVIRWNPWIGIKTQVKGAYFPPEEFFSIDDNSINSPFVLATLSAKVSLDRIAWGLPNAASIDPFIRINWIQGNHAYNLYEVLKLFVLKYETNELVTYGSDKQEQEWKGNWIGQNIQL